MDDVVEAIARRFERAADRMRNAGEYQAERHFRNAAVDVRRRRDLAEAMQLEQIFSATGQGGRVELQAFAGSTEYDYASSTADPISAQTGQYIADTAASVTTDYKARGVSYQLGSDASDGGDQADCNHFVMDVLQQVGFSGLTPFWTGSIASDPQFVEVPAGEQQPGDVMVTTPPQGQQHGHMGVYAGEDSQGRPTGYQMGTHGANLIPWTPTTVPGGPISYYRPRK